MFAFISKKISVPQGLKLRCIDWNSANDLVAVGGEDGFLQVLRFGRQDSSGNISLATNQTLQGHKATVDIVCWNQKHERLTSADELGTIIVWAPSNGKWSEEMKNERTKDKVTALRWNASLDKICVAYKTGHVLVGNIEGIAYISCAFGRDRPSACAGKRYWWKDLNIEIDHVAWSPDSSIVMLGGKEGAFQVLDANGNFISNISFNVKGGQRLNDIVAFEWFKGNGKKGEHPSLAVASLSGHICLLKNEADSQPIEINTPFDQLLSLKWNGSGAVIAACGKEERDEANKKAGQKVVFYSRAGDTIGEMKVPGNDIRNLDWGMDGLNVGVCSESHLYIASIKYRYVWTYFSNTLVYSYPDPTSGKDCVVFLDATSDEAHQRTFERVLSVESCSDRCALLSQDCSGQRVITIFAPKGDELCSRKVHLDCECVTIINSLVFAAAGQTLWIWSYRINRKKTDSTEEETVKLYTVDHQTGIAQIKLAVPQPVDVDHAISAIDASDDSLAISFTIGSVLLYELPSMRFRSSFSMNCGVSRLSLNSDESRLATMDKEGCLRVIATNNRRSLKVAASDRQEATPLFTRHDVWDLKWSTDEPDRLAFLDKSRLYVLSGENVEEPVATTFRLCRFADLEIDCVSLDTLLSSSDPGIIDTTRLFVKYQTKPLKDTIKLLEELRLEDAWNRAQGHPHRRLWNMIADSALQRAEFGLAERSFLRCADYHGVQFCKKINLVKAPFVQRAMIAYSKGRFDEAEEYYLRNDRPDLAIQMRCKLGDFLRAEELVKKYGSDDYAKTNLWNLLGDAYADQSCWDKAAHYYAKSRNSDRWLECLFHSRDSKSLARLAKELPEKTAMLFEIGDRLERLGACDAAVFAFQKGGDLKRAIDCCVRLNEWQLAVDLSAQGDYPQMDVLLQRHVNSLLKADRRLDAVDLYSKAGRHLESSKLLIAIAKELDHRKAGPLLLKKIHILSALEIQQYRGKVLTSVDQPTSIGGKTSNSFSSTTQRTTAQTLAGRFQGVVTSVNFSFIGLVTLDETSAECSNRALDDAWHCAEGFHFYVLVNTMIDEGRFEDAMRAALHLRRFADVLDSESIYALLALSSFYCGFLKQCSRAFVRLETLSDISEEKRLAYRNLARKIFTQVAPNDPHVLRETKERSSRTRQVLNDLLPSTATVCTRTARHIRSKDDFIKCACCRHCWIQDGDLTCWLCRHDNSRGQQPKAPLSAIRE